MLQKRIFIYLSDIQQLPLITSLVKENQNYLYGIYIKGISDEEFTRTRVGKFNNISFVDITTVNLNILSSYGCFITSDATFCSDCTMLPLITKVFTSISVPVLHLQDKPHWQKEKTLHFPNIELSWYNRGKNNDYIIGYPPYNGEEKDTSDGEFMLVISDLHRPCYTDKDRTLFYNSIFEYARQHTQAAIIWKEEEHCHPCIERLVHNYTEFYSNDRHKIVFCNEKVLLNKFTKNELIKKAHCVIGTTTIPNILDCELYKKPSVFFEGENVNVKEISALPNNCIFHNAQELEKIVFDNKPAITKTGELMPYNNSVYISAIEKNYHIQNNMQADYIDALLYADIIRKRTTTQGHTTLPYSQAETTNAPQTTVENKDKKILGLNAYKICKATIKNHNIAFAEAHGLIRKNKEMLNKKQYYKLIYKLFFYKFILRK